MKPESGHNRYPFGIVQVAAEETQKNTSYRFHNLSRPDGSGLVVQLTISGAAFFEDKGHRNLVLPDHAMLFTHAEDSTYGYPDDTTAVYRHQYIEFSDTTVTRPVFDAVRNNFGSIVSLPKQSIARGIFSEIVERFKNASFIDRYHESELLFRLLIEINREQIDGARERDPIAFGHNYILNRYRYACNVKLIAEACGLTREYFTRGFKLRYKVGPKDMLSQLRLRHAENLLRSTSMPVEEVSVASGYASTNVFCRRFKQLKRMSPGRFRELAQKGK